MIESRKREVLQSKRLEWFEFILVLSIAFLPGTIKSIFIAIMGEPLYNTPPELMGFGFTIANIEKILALVLLGYILFRQGKRINYLGLSIRFKDLLWGIALFVLAMIVSYAYNLLVYYLLGHANQAANVGFLKTDITIWYWLFLFINPFFEEILVRGFVIAKLNELSGSKIIAVSASVLIQTLYHTYQGLIVSLGYALVFLLFSLYFVRTNRLHPIIIAHLIMDLLILLTI